MYKEKKIKDLRPSDRVFQIKENLIKVRLISKKIVSQNKIFGPSAISFQLSACICDKKGKAIPEGEGHFSIMPHTLTFPLMELGKNQNDLENGLMEALQLLIEKTLSWYESQKAAEKVLKSWENS